MTITRATTLALNAWTRANRRAADDYYERNREPDEADPPQPRPLKTHCAHGHEFDKKNTYVDSRGWQTCRICAAKRRRDARAKLRGAA